MRRTTISSRVYIGRTARLSGISSKQIPNHASIRFYSNSMESILKKQCDHVIEQQKRECLGHLKRHYHHTSSMVSNSHAHSHQITTCTTTQRLQLKRPSKSLLSKLKHINNNNLKNNLLIQKRSNHTNNNWNNLNNLSIFELINNNPAKITIFNELKQWLPSILFTDARGFGKFRKKILIHLQNQLLAILAITLIITQTQTRKQQKKQKKQKIQKIQKIQKQLQNQVKYYFVII